MHGGTGDKDTSRCNLDAHAYSINISMCAFVLVCICGQDPLIVASMPEAKANRLLYAENRYAMHARAMTAMMLVSLQQQSLAIFCGI